MPVSKRQRRRGTFCSGLVEIIALAATLASGCNPGTITEPRLTDAESVCTPDCAGRDCGPDRCGGSCGTCVSGDLCNARGVCYDPDQCTPICAGTECGDDGCGGSCGTCEAGRLCDSSGACYDPNACTPDCEGKTCGGDGCGGICGTCEAQQACNQTGHCYDPVQCIPECEGKQCGADGCGGDCGTCNPGDQCDGSGICIAPPSCIPDCTERECGDDGCGESCGSCATGERCDQAAGVCEVPVGLVFTDAIESDDPQFGFDAIGLEHPIGQSVEPSDANGANASRVPDPLGGPGYAVRQYGVLDTGGARSQLAVWSFSQPAFADLATSGEPVYVAQEIYFPETIDAGGDGWAWLSLLDWHTTGEGSGRWHTSPGIMLKQDGSMQIQLAWGGGAGANVNGASSEWSSIGMPVGRWFDLEMRWQMRPDQSATVSVWIDGELALEQTGVQTAGAGHGVVELYLKLYGSDQGHTPWNPVGISKYVRNVRIAGQRIWR